MDLLRIICMMMVVCIHTLGWVGLIENTLAPGTPNYFICNILFAFCLVAVNCFVMITGYFQCTSTFKLKKCVSTWGTALFYSIVIYFILILTGNLDFSLKELIKHTMVFTLDRYWFITAYLLLYMVSPFLNCAIRAMSRKTHLMCCCTLLLLFSVLHNIVYICDFGDVQGGYSFLWFCILYIVAAYFRSHVTTKIKHGGILFYILSVLCICGERFAAYYITPYIFGKVQLTSLFYSYNSIVMVIASLALFQFFRGLEIHSERLTKCITGIAPLTLTVYLIHEHDSLRMVIWDYLHPGKYYDKPWLIFYVILCVIIIFCGCCIIEWVRKKVTIVTGIAGKIAKLCDMIQWKCETFFDHVTKTEQNMLK